MFQLLNLWMKSSSVTIQMKAYWTVLSCGTVYHAFQDGSNFLRVGKIHSGESYGAVFSHSRSYRQEFANVGTMLFLNTFGSWRVKWKVTHSPVSVTVSIAVPVKIPEKIMVRLTSLSFLLLARTYEENVSELFTDTTAILNLLDLRSIMGYPGALAQYLRALFGQKENFTVYFSGKRRSLLHPNTTQRYFFPLQSFSRRTS